MDLALQNYLQQLTDKNINKDNIYEYRTLD